MESDLTLESALAKTETDAESALKAAKTVTTSLSKFRKAAKTGNLKDLKSAIEASERAIANLRQQAANAKEGWTFDEEGYLKNGSYSRELIDTGKRLSVSIFERDDRLYCYPALIRVSSGERMVFVDKKREPRIRPSVLVNILKDLQKKPARFRPEAFLESLFKAYDRIRASRPELMPGNPVRLLEMYEMLTLLPGLAQEYTKQEFARDVYLLHGSGIDTTRNGAKVSFPDKTRDRSVGAISVIDKDGVERRYFFVSFIKIVKEQPL